ncbi:DUF4873 domain-containing protein [Allorhizocola rhizosphaerae]|uniref:DUF4873 domain-containing protein n=1 Tax=Allorhizocola rhizosphaerae TaxID=1872709 RepID=UPI000E3CFAA1|nr:DUF4873 domain-containing protein [Allorhizocola rhizosphaerae]
MMLETVEGSFTVEVKASACVEPIDGRLHITGRIAPHADVAALVRKGVREARLEGVSVRLMEIDPWGGVLIRY